jgi:hypothetical protein
VLPLPTTLTTFVVPDTNNFEVGDAVPIPTLPSSLTTNDGVAPLFSILNVVDPLVDPEPLTCNSAVGALNPTPTTEPLWNKFKLLTI